MTKRAGCFRLFLAIGVLPATAPVRAHAQPPAAAASSAPGTTARAVAVGVVAEDEQGRPVLDLRREDFIVLDGGREEGIVSFLAPPMVSAASASPASPTPPETLPPDTFTNRLELLTAGAASVTAILFDGLNTPRARQAYARQRVLAFLEEITPRHAVSLFTLGRGLSLLQDFTSDTGALVRALEGYRGDLSGERAAARPEGLRFGVARFDAWLDELELNLADRYAEDRALRTVRSLIAIARHVERVPGRKNLVWVSGSFPEWIRRDSAPLPQRPNRAERRFGPEIERAARALTDANLAVYPVDARGLMAPAEYGPERETIGREARFSDRSGQAAMQALAERTGGQAFYNSNDLGRAFQRADEDSRNGYSLGYQPSHDEWNGKFREIAVKVDRPGVRLRHRRGYFALPGEPADEWYRRDALEAAKWSPVDATRVGLTVRVVPSGGRGLGLELRLQTRDLSLRPIDGSWRGKLDVWLVQLGPGDELLDTLSQVAELRLTGADHERAREGDLPLMARLERTEKAALLRVLVRDVSTGALGSLTIPLDRVARSPSGQ
jgi:VWFA-related protein